jgi:hypothetical protein
MPGRPEDLGRRLMRGQATWLEVVEGHLEAIPDREKRLAYLTAWEDQARRERNQVLLAAMARWRLRQQLR